MFLKRRAAHRRYWPVLLAAMAGLMALSLMNRTEMVTVQVTNRSNIPIQVTVGGSPAPSPRGIVPNHGLVQPGTTIYVKSAPMKGEGAVRLIFRTLDGHEYCSLVESPHRIETVLSDKRGIWVVEMLENRIARTVLVR